VHSVWKQLVDRFFEKSEGNESTFFSFWNTVVEGKILYLKIFSLISWVISFHSREKISRLSTLPNDIAEVLSISKEITL
jgi:hypothetical protein